MDAGRDASADDGVAVDPDAALQALLAEAAGGAANATAQAARKALCAAFEALCSAGAPDALARARGPLDGATVALMSRHAGSDDVQALGCRVFWRLEELGVTNWCDGAVHAAATALCSSRCHVDALVTLTAVIESTAPRLDADAHACAMEAVTVALQLSDDALRESDTDVVRFRSMCCELVVQLMPDPAEVPSAVAPGLTDSAACDNGRRACCRGDSA